MKNPSIYRWLLQRVGKRLPGLLVMTVSAAGTALMGVFFALGSKNVVNAAVSGTRQELINAGIAQAAVIVAILVFQLLERYFRHRLTATLDRDWKENLTHRILRSDYAKICGYHSGELINRLNNDVRAVDDGLITILPSLASMVTRLVSVVAVLVTMAPVFTLAIVVMGVAAIVATTFTRRYLRELNKAVSASAGRLSGFLQEIFEKLLLVQAMNVAPEVERRGDKLLEDRYQLQKKRWSIMLIANSCVNILGYVSGFVALIWCANGIFEGTMSFGELTAMTQLVSQLQTPFTSLSGVLPSYIAMTAACERLMELEAACENPEQETVVGVDYAQLQAISARELSFSYGREQVFTNCDFTLPKGAFAVITGPSGIGKSTILKLLLGIFRPTDGTLELECEGGNVKAGRGTRDLFAYVPQGNLLFSGTLRENLLLTCPDATEEQIAEAIYVSHMDAFLPKLPNGLETVLGENAHGLSEGQAQRLSIARAVLGGAPILLLDEATSALDAQSEETVLERIRQLPGKTCIAVTHRPRALALADWQIEVSKGSIVCRRINKHE